MSSSIRLNVLDCLIISDIYTQHELCHSNITKNMMGDAIANEIDNSDLGVVNNIRASECINIASE